MVLAISQLRDHQLAFVESDVAAVVRADDGPVDDGPADDGPVDDAMSAAEVRTARKELARLERQVQRLEQQESGLHDELAEHATDYAKVADLDARLREVRGERERVEEEWLSLAERVEAG